MTYSGLFRSGAKILLGLFLYLLFLKLLEPIREALFPFRPAIEESIRTGKSLPPSYFQMFLSHCVLGPLAVFLSVLLVTWIIKPRAAQYIHGLMIGLIPELFFLGGAIWASTLFPPEERGDTPFLLLVFDAPGWLIFLGGALLSIGVGAATELVMSRRRAALVSNVVSLA